MIKKITLFAIALMLISFTSGDLEIGGITMPDTMKAGNTDLTLNGAGIRTKFFLKLYVGGLYLQNKTTDESKVLSEDKPMAIRLHIISSMITSEKMEDATREGFKKSLGSKKSSMSSEIDAFIDVFKEEIKDGDIFDMVYIPGTGVEISKNEKHSKTIKGLAFKNALFGIWIGKKPAQDSLKEGMLGTD
ncbi:MAG: chalcone isomerase family protein [Flavobacteriaceae bacterium]|nr:chalcone isomerase family protein [Flavobacteriaceae bacterium]